MTGQREVAGGRRGSRWRIVLWGIAALILLPPAIAMQFTSEVVWGLADFLIFGAMLFAACGAFELAARATDNMAYRVAVGVAVAAAFLLIWLNLAVGIIGSENNPANLMYGGVLAVAAIGSTIAHFQSRGMARVMLATALAQAAVAAIALILGHIDAFALTSFFVVPWLASAWLFQIAARTPLPSDKHLQRRR